MPASAPRLVRRLGVVAGLTALMAAPATVAPAADGPAQLSAAAFVPPAGTRQLVAEHLRLAAHERALTRTHRVARRLAAAQEKPLPASRYRARLARRSVRGLLAEQRRLQARLRAHRRTGGAPDVAIPAQLAAIAACESGGDPGAIGGGGSYRGKYQFSYATWSAVGGQGDPAAAPEVEQDRRAALLYARSGPGQWPVCGR